MDSVQISAPASSPRLRRAGRQWLIPFGSAVALVVGNGSISVFAFGVFMRPLEAEFGWSRASISAALALCGLLSAISLPLVGLLMDRFGIRRPLLVAICLFGANVAAIGTAGGLLSFTLLTALSGMTGAAQSPLGYVKSIASRFDRNRGLAIGVAMSGVGLGTALVPLYTQWLLNAFGWRAAYAGLGAAIVLLAGPVIFALIRDDPASPLPRRVAAADGSAPTFPGLAFGEAVATHSFWLLAATVLLASLAVNGCLVHAVPMLVDRGWTPAEAAGVMVAAGLAGMLGRLLAGFLIDRFFAPHVAAAFFFLATGGMLLLATNSYVIAGIFTVGLAAGAEVDMIGFLVSRYFGLRSLGQIYGLLFAIFTIGAGFGPYLIGTAYSLLHNYNAALIGAGVLLLGASVCLLLIGPYSYGADRCEEPDAA